MQQRLNIHYRITWSGNWHVGSGFRTAATDRLIQRLGGRDGVPYVPGSQIKGVLRHACERFSAALELESIDPHATGTEQPRRLVAHFRPLGSSGLIVDRLFGSRFQGDCLFVDNAMPVDVAEGRGSLAATEVRTRTAMDRVTRTVKERHLFSTEMADGQLQLAGRIRARHPAGVLTVEEDGFPYEYALLVAGLLSIDQLGGDKSCGLGQCAIDVRELRWNGTTITTGDALKSFEEPEWGGLVDLVREGQNQ